MQVYCASCSVKSKTGLDKLTKTKFPMLQNILFTTQPFDRFKHLLIKSTKNNQIMKNDP